MQTQNTCHLHLSPWDDTVRSALVALPLNSTLEEICIKTNVFPMIIPIYPNYPKHAYIIYFMWMGVSACVCLCTICLPGSHGGQKRASDPLRLELQGALSCHVLWMEAGSLGSSRAPDHWATSPGTTASCCTSHSLPPLDRMCRSWADFYFSLFVWESLTALFSSG